MNNSARAAKLSLGGAPKGPQSTGPGGYYRLRLRGIVRVCVEQLNFVHVVVAFREDSEIDIDEYITKERAKELDIKENSEVAVEFITSSVKI